VNILQTELPGVVLVKPDVHGDARGYFVETWNQQRYAEAGLDAVYVQDNLSYSDRGVLRGLHFQHPRGQGKLVQVLEGEVFDVAVDVRLGSPTFGRWVGVTLRAENKHQLYIPRGFAHGFCVLSERALFSYKCTDFYNPATEQSIRWDDPQIDILWPLHAPTLSSTDAAAPRLSELDEQKLPNYPADEHVDQQRSR
jgi:dTDP-4-dehydrorhamnose 3,5-epimerase